MYASNSLQLSRFEGYLKKWTNYMMQYQRRWFVYENGYLTYYRDRSEVGELTRAQIHLLGCDLRRYSNFRFTITKNKEILFALRAETKLDFDNWIATISRGIIECNESDTKSSNQLTNMIPSSNSVSLKKFDNTHDDFVSHAFIVTENCKQISVLSAEIKNQVLSNLGKITDLNNRELYVETYNKIKAFKELNEKVSNSIEELVRQSELLAECAYAAVYRASQNNSLIVDLMDNSQSIPNTDNDKLNMEKINTNLHTSEGDSEEDIFYDVESFPTEGSNHELDNISFTKIKMKKSVRHLSQQNISPIQHVRSVSDISFKKKQLPTHIRTVIPPRPNIKLSLYNLIKNMIGKDLSKVPLPVNFNEPLSMLQRVTESLEYSELLDKASTVDCPLLQMCYVLAFSISNYCSTSVRTNKPFNPLLGETFEYDRTEDLGWRVICEQVSHHPPVCALHVEGDGWTMWETFNVKSKFMAKYLEIQPQGLSQLVFTRTGFRYSWNKVITSVNNIVIGTLWIDQFGKLNMKNHSTGDSATVEFIPYSLFNSANHKKIVGIVRDHIGNHRYSISGYWDKFIECSKLIKKSESSNASIDRHILWTATRLPHGAEKMYFFSIFACSLNEINESVAPTDSRRRPDQRAMENGNFDLANTIKIELEEAQRMRRAIILEQAIKDKMATNQTAMEEIYEPLWFKVDKTVQSNVCNIYVYKGGYWEAKLKKDFSM
ncbi:hypothetical protein HZS_865, partial [Henneguya salminicola]